MNLVSRPLTRAFAFCLLLAPLPASAFELTSPDVSEGTRIPEAQVFNGFGCSGGNVPPALTWSHAPAEAKSFALSLYDPDAPTGSGFWHWVVVDIPATAEGLTAGAGEAGAAQLEGGARQLRTDFGSPGYGGPCPPEGHGLHRYVFTLHALDVETLALPEDATAALAGFMVRAHSLASARLTAVYWR